MGRPLAEPIPAVVGGLKQPASTLAIEPKSASGDTKGNEGLSTLTATHWDANVAA